MKVISKRVDALTLGEAYRVSASECARQSEPVWIGWRRAARAQSSLVSFCLHVLLAVAYILSIRVQNLIRYLFHSSAETPPRCHAGVHMCALEMTDGTQSEGQPARGDDLKKSRCVNNSESFWERGRADFNQYFGKSWVLVTGEKDETLIMF